MKCSERLLVEWGVAPVRRYQISLIVSVRCCGNYTLELLDGCKGTVSLANTSWGEWIKKMLSKPRFNPETSSVHIEGLTLLHYIGIYGTPQWWRGQEACNATCCGTGVIVPNFLGQKSCFLNTKAATVSKMLAITYENTRSPEYNNNRR